jgi:hypothetical protein
MQLLHDTTLLYFLIATIAAGGIVCSREQEGQNLLVLSKGRIYSWRISSLSILATSFFQFWIAGLPLFPLAHSELLFMSALVASFVVPVFLSRDFALSPRRFRKTLSPRLRILLSVIVLVFYAFIQPLAILYLAERTLSLYFMNSSYFSLVFLIVVAGICALLGGKNVAAYMSLPFAVTAAAVVVGIIFCGISISDLLTLLRFPMGEAERFFIARKFAESNWVVGCTGFCVVSWWIWWSDKGILLASEISDEKEPAFAKIVVAFSFVGLALIVLVRRSPGFILRDISIPESFLLLRQYEVLAFFLLLSLVSIFISAFVRSFRSVGSIVQTYLYDAAPHGERSEKHILAARLAITVGVLLSIFLIPFVQQTGVELLVVYVAYLACFAGSFTAIFIVFLIWQSRSEAGMGAGVLGGVSGGVIALIILLDNHRPSGVVQFSLYEIATAVFLLSVACAVGAIYFHSVRIKIRASSKAF